MKLKWPTIALAISLMVIMLAVWGCPHQPGPNPRLGENRPGTDEKAGPRPSKLLAERNLHNPPVLRKTADVSGFIAWAGMSTIDERETARKTIASASENDEVCQGLIEEVEKSWKIDHSRALLVLSILGEMRSSCGERYLMDFANRPLPETGTVVEGEIIERTALATLQAKAVDGLAYMNTRNANDAVLRIVSKHPSIIVRAEAISAYAWNQGETKDARATLLRHIRKGEEIYLDRVRRVKDEGAETFNRKVKVFLKNHPEIIPSKPKKAEKDHKQKKPEYFDAEPPMF